MKKLLLLFFGMLFMATTTKAESDGLKIITLADQGHEIYVTGISSDGKYVTGYVDRQGSSFVWDKTNGINQFDYGKGPSSANAISNNGVVTGQFSDSTYMYKNWNDESIALLSAGYFNGEKWVSLGLRPGVEPVELGGSQADGISADGTKVGGAWVTQTNVDRLVPVIWTNGVATELDFINNGQGARIMSLSDNGSVAGGWEAPFNKRTPIIWINGVRKSITSNGEVGDGEVGGVSCNGKYAALSVNRSAAIYDIDNDKLTIIGSKPGALLGGTATAVSNNGVVVGYSQIGMQMDREAFIYTHQLGLVSLSDYLDKLNINRPAELQLQTPMGISADGTKIVGFGFYNHSSGRTYMSGWYIDIANHLTGLNPAENLIATEPISGTINLTWDAVLADLHNTFVGYNIYRNGEKINVSPVTTTNYNDVSVAKGSYTYKVTAVWNTNEESRATETNINVALLTIPFFDDFSSNSLDTNYWNNNNTLSQWKISEYEGISQPAISYNIPLGSEYNGSITSPYINITSSNSLFLAYNISIPLDWDRLSDADSLKVEIYDGTNWNIVDRYIPLPIGEQTFRHKVYDISSIATGKNNIRVRFTSFGVNKGSALSWLIDNVNIYSSEQAPTMEAPVNVNAHRENGTVRIDWSDPNNVTKLTYNEYDDPSMMDRIGNEGVPFVISNKFSKEDLATFNGHNLTSISAFLGRNEGISTFAVYKLAVYQDGTRIVNQDITSYTPNAWNTFTLATPVLVDATKDLYFGIEIVSHDPADWPIGVTYSRLISKENDLINIYEGKANLYSINGGETWGTLKEFDMNYVNMAIYAILKKEITSTPKDRILGYKVYRDGINILNQQIGYDAITLLNNYIDIDPVNDAESCYSVSAYYMMQSELKSDNSCITTGIEDDIIQGNGIGIYPNPFKDEFTVSLPEAINNGVLVLYDINGKKVYERVVNQKEIQVSVPGLPIGIYTLQVIQNNKVVSTNKLMKQ